MYHFIDLTYVRNEALHYKAAISYRLSEGQVLKFLCASKTKAQLPSASRLSQTQDSRLASYEIGMVRADWHRMRHANIELKVQAGQQPVMGVGRCQ